MLAEKNPLYDLALFGGKPVLDKQLPMNQYYSLSWEKYVANMQGIFDRQYYTNHGPLAQKLEHHISTFLKVKHVICVTNAMIGLIIAAKAMLLSGKVIMPAFTFPATAQAVTWAGLTPAFCDIDPTTHHITPETVERVIDNDVSAILAVNLWGGSCDQLKMSKYAEEKNISIYFDSAHSFGCKKSSTYQGCNGEAEIFSLCTQTIGPIEGGCIVTNDDKIAARLRNIRSSYGTGEVVPVPLTGNGRMSEAQAAMILMGLENINNNINNNQIIFDSYSESIDKIPGLHIIMPHHVEKSNYQYVICKIDESCFGLSQKELLTVLKAENIDARTSFHSGIHHCFPYNTLYPHHSNLFPNTDMLCKTTIQLPIGPLVSREIVYFISKILAISHMHAHRIRRKLGG